MKISHWSSKYIVILSLLVTVSIACASTIGHGNIAREVLDAKEFATDYLIENGAPTTISLTLTDSTKYLFTFHDKRQSCFILVTRDRYSNMLSNRVLALTIGAPNSGEKNRVLQSFYTYYENLLADMESARIPIENRKVQKTRAVMPLINYIRWGQHTFKNVFGDQSEKVIAGCGPVAVGQIMKYYEWPDTIDGDGYYWKAGNRQSCQMDGKKIDWSKIKDIYTYQDNDFSNLDTLMKEIGAAVHVSYTDTASSSWILNLEDAMVKNFRYSSEMTCVYNDDVEDSTLVNIIRKELQQERPVILDVPRHFIICDGMYDDFLHFNFGWRGRSDGWYRFPSISGHRKDFFIEKALVNIFPKNKESVQLTALPEQVTLRKNRKNKILSHRIEPLRPDTMPPVNGIHKTLTINVPGTLRSLLTNEESLGISHLTVKGKINGADIRLIRRMAGCKNESSGKGILHTLNLADATIVKDTCSYLDSRTSTMIQYYKKEFEEYHKATGGDWTAFCKTGGNKAPLYYISREDSLSYTLHWCTKDNEIGQNMFGDCDNLRVVILPRNISAINTAAFTSCIRLRDITIPSMISSIPYGCFNGCVSLQNIFVCSDSPLLTYHKGVNIVRTYGKSTLHAFTVDSTLQTYKDAINRYMPPPKKKVKRNKVHIPKGAIVRHTKEKINGVWVPVTIYKRIIR